MEAKEVRCHVYNISPRFPVLSKINPFKAFSKLFFQDPIYDYLLTNDLISKLAPNLHVLALNPCMHLPKLPRALLSLTPDIP